MILLTFTLSACADTAAPTPEAADSKVPSEDVLKEEIEQAGAPEVDLSQAEAIGMIEHFHGQQEVEAYRQRLLGEKAAEVSATLKAQEAAAREAAANAEVAAKADAATIEAKIDAAEAAQDGK